MFILTATGAMRKVNGDASFQLLLKPLLLDGTSELD